MNTTSTPSPYFFTIVFSTVRGRKVAHHVSGHNFEPGHPCHQARSTRMSLAKAEILISMDHAVRINATTYGIKATVSA